MKTKNKDDLNNAEGPKNEGDLKDGKEKKDKKNIKLMTYEIVLNTYNFLFDHILISLEGKSKFYHPATLITT